MDLSTLAQKRLSFESLHLGLLGFVSPEAQRAKRFMRKLSKRLEAIDVFMHRTDTLLQKITEETQNQTDVEMGREEDNKAKNPQEQCPPEELEERKRCLSWRLQRGFQAQEELLRRASMKLEQLGFPLRADTEMTPVQLNSDDYVIVM